MSILPIEIFNSLKYFRALFTTFAFRPVGNETSLRPLETLNLMESFMPVGLVGHVSWLSHLQLNETVSGQLSSYPLHRPTQDIKTMMARKRVPI